MLKARKASCTSSRPQHRAAGSSNVTSSVHAAASSPPPADIRSSQRRHAGGRAGRTHAQACCTTTKHIPLYILATIFSCCAAREQDTHTGLAMASAAGALVVWARAGGEPTAACRTLLPRATIRESTAQPNLVWFAKRETFARVVTGLHKNANLAADNPTCDITTTPRPLVTKPRPDRILCKVP